MPRLVMISLNDRGNLGARQLVARAKALGHEAFLINYGQYEHDTYKFTDDIDSPNRSHAKAVLVKLLHRLSPIDILGISYRSLMAELAADLARTIREARVTYKLIIAGGIGATSDPLQANTWANGYCVGEGDFAIGPLMAGKPLKEVQNIESPSVHLANRAPLLANLDEAPFPDYDPDTTFAIVNGDLIEADGRLDNDIGAYPLLTSRGCPRACTYCHNSTVHNLYRGQTYVRQRSVENVMDEIAWARSRWEVKMLSIYDDLFIANPPWVFEFAKRLRQVWPVRPRFWCMTHPCYIREDVISALVGSGLEEVCLGVQSGSERILKLYRRGTSEKQILDAAETLGRFPGLRVKIDIISANPMETEQDLLDTMTVLQKIVNRCPNSYPGLSRLTIFPGSKIADELTQAECNALHTDRQDFIDGLYRAAFVERWRILNLTDAMRRYNDFQTFRLANTWPEDQGILTDSHWQPLTTWLDKGAP